MEIATDYHGLNGFPWIIGDAGQKIRVKLWMPIATDFHRFSRIIGDAGQKIRVKLWMPIATDFHRFSRIIGDAGQKIRVHLRITHWAWMERVRELRGFTRVN